MGDVSVTMRPPFDPATLDTLRGCDDALGVVSAEILRIHDEGRQVASARRVQYLVGLKAEIKQAKRDIADRRNSDQLVIYVRHLKAILVERFGEGAEAMLREAGERTEQEFARIAEARRLKGVGSAVPTLGASGGARRRKTEAA
jgi:hypothetical protein